MFECLSRFSQQKIASRKLYLHKGSWQLNWSLQLESFTVTIMHWLITTKCMSHRWLRVCFTGVISFFCPQHFQDIEHYPESCVGCNMWNRNCLPFWSTSVHSWILMGSVFLILIILCLSTLFIIGLWHFLDLDHYLESCVGCRGGSRISN